MRWLSVYIGVGMNVGIGYRIRTETRREEKEELRILGWKNTRENGGWAGELGKRIIETNCV